MNGPTCEQVRTWLSDLLAGEESPAASEEMTAHLSACDPCRRSIDELVRQDLELSELAARENLQTCVARLRENLASANSPETEHKTRTRTTRRHVRPVRRMYSGYPIGLTLAAAGLLVGIVLIAVQSGSPSVRPLPPGSTPRKEVATEEARKEEPARNEEEQKRARERLEQLEREKRKLEEARKSEEEAERRRKEEELARTREAKPPEREKTVKPEERPAPPPLNPPTPAVPETRETQVVLGTLENVAGEVFVTSEGAQTAAKKGQPLLSGRGILAVGESSIAVLRFPDGTRLVVGPDTVLERLLEDPARGKAVHLARGTVWADVSPQPAERPLVFATARAEACVLGTSLKLVEIPGSAGSTRLEVEKGKVRLTRLQDKKAVEVAAGHYAVAAVGLELAVRLTPPPADLILWLSADEGVLGGGKTVARWSDKSGRRCHAVQALPACMPTYVKNGPEGTPAVEFDGTDDHLKVPDSPALNAMTDQVTLTAWVYITERTGKICHILVRHLDTPSPGDRDQYGIGFKPDVFSFTAAVSDRSRDLQGGLPPLKRWVHLAGTSDGKTIRLYIDGVLSRAMDFPVRERIPMKAQPVFIGAGQHDGPKTPIVEGFRGLLHEVRVYSRALSASEVAALAARP